jgi:predicted ATPase
MMVLNEPETSLHPDLLPALSRLIIKAAENTQVWVVTHSPALISGLTKNSGARVIELQKELGQTQVKGQDLLIGRNGGGLSDRAVSSLLSPVQPDRG